MTAFVEHGDGRYKLVDFQDFVQRYPLPVEAGQLEPAADLLEA